QIFNLLKHPLRRGILKQLSKSPQAYSQILRNLNIQESSILNYHLREMGDLLIKKDVDGKYVLNEIGEICLQLILRVKEKEDIHSFNKFQILIENLKSTLFLFQIVFLPLVVILAEIMKTLKKKATEKDLCPPSLKEYKEKIFRDKNPFI
ncbi:unnamed protein product, partial [marine sediment metagenome]